MDCSVISASVSEQHYKRVIYESMSYETSAYGDDHGTFNVNIFCEIMDNSMTPT